MLQINNLTIPIGGDETLLRQKAAKILGVRPAEFLSFSLQRQSIDARKKDDVHLVCAVRATLNKRKEESVLRRALRNVTAAADAPYVPPTLGRTSSLPPVVVGMGPAGLFAALFLARHGLSDLCIYLVEVYNPFGFDRKRRTAECGCWHGKAHLHIRRSRYIIVGCKIREVGRSCRSGTIAAGVQTGKLLVAEETGYEARFARIDIYLIQAILGLGASRPEEAS